MALSNAKNESFCLIWHETGNKSEAYRKSHPNCKNWKDETVHNKASALSKQGEVLARFEELQADALKSHGITIDSLLVELEEARVMGKKEGAAGAMVTATMSKAKLVGLDKYVEPSVTVNVRTTLDDFYA